MRNSQRSKYILCVCMLLVGIFSAVILYKSLRPSSFDVPYEILSQIEAEAYMDFEEGYLLLDVQSSDMYAQEHMDGAVNVPYDSLVEDFDAGIYQPDQMIYIYGEDEETSRKAAMKLCQLGYNSVACVLRPIHRINSRNKQKNAEVESNGSVD